MCRRNTVSPRLDIAVWKVHHILLSANKIRVAKALVIIAVQFSKLRALIAKVNHITIRFPNRQIEIIGRVPRQLDVNLRRASTERHAVAAVRPIHGFGAHEALRVRVDDLEAGDGHDEAPVVQKVPLEAGGGGVAHAGPREEGDVGDAEEVAAEGRAKAGRGPFGDGGEAVAGGDLHLSRAADSADAGAGATHVRGERLVGRAEKYERRLAESEGVSVEVAEAEATKLSTLWDETPLAGGGGSSIEKWGIGVGGCEDEGEEDKNEEEEAGKCGCGGHFGLQKVGGIELED